MVSVEREREGRDCGHRLDRGTDLRGGGHCERGSRSGRGRSWRCSLSEFLGGVGIHATGGEPRLLMFIPEAEFLTPRFIAGSREQLVVVVAAA